MVEEIYAKKEDGTKDVLGYRCSICNYLHLKQNFSGSWFLFRDCDDALEAAEECEEKGDFKPGYRFLQEDAEGVREIIRRGQELNLKYLMQ